MDNQEEQVVTSCKFKGLNSKGCNKKRICKKELSFFKSILKKTILLSIIMLIIIDQQQIEAKKYKKEKKMIKSLVKGLIFKNLSTKKNILPLPVPIPGKWQQILNSLIETSGKLYHYTDSLEHKKFSTKTTTNKLSSSTAAKNGLSLIMAALDNRYAPSTSTSIFKNPFKVNKKQTPSSSSSSSSALNSAELANIKKLTRQAAAKYAGHLISNQIPNKSTSGASDNGKTGNNLIDGNLGKILSRASNKSSSNLAGSTKGQNDYLVTVVNLIKLLRQIKELDHTKLLNINKKSSIFFNPYNLPPPVLSMNINNRKSLMNKMNYIHKLTTDLNHRTRIL